MSRWMGWRWEFDGSSSTQAGKRGRGGRGVVCGVRWTVLLWAGLRLRRGERATGQQLRGGLWSPVDCFAVGGAAIVLEGRERERENGLEEVGGATIVGGGRTDWKTEEEREGKKQKGKNSFEPFSALKT